MDPSVLVPERAQGSAVSLGFAAVLLKPPALLHQQPPHWGCAVLFTSANWGPEIISGALETTKIL